MFSNVWRPGTSFIRCEKLVPNFHKCEKSVPNHQICEKLVSISHVNNGIKTLTCEELVPNDHTCEKLVPKYHRCEELVLNRHRCQSQNSEELESNAKRSRFGGILSMWGICMYAIWNLTSCVFFTKYEILVWNMWRLGTNFSRAVRNWYQLFTVWTLRSVKFAVQQDLFDPKNWKLLSTNFSYWCSNYYPHAFFKKTMRILQSPPSVRPSVTLSSPKPIDEILPNLVCELLTYMGHATAQIFGPAPWGPGEGPNGQI